MDDDDDDDYGFHDCLLVLWFGKEEQCVVVFVHCTSGDHLSIKLCRQYCNITVDVV